jgi:hypothetical protein
LCEMTNPDCYVRNPLFSMLPLNHWEK